MKEYDFNYIYDLFNQEVFTDILVKAWYGEESRAEIYKAFDDLNMFFLLSKEEIQKVILMPEKTDVDRPYLDFFNRFEIYRAAIKKEYYQEVIENIGHEINDFFVTDKGFDQFEKPLYLKTNPNLSKEKISYLEKIREKYNRKLKQVIANLQIYQYYNTTFSQANPLHMKILLDNLIVDSEHDHSSEGFIFKNLQNEDELLKFIVFEYKNNLSFYDILALTHELIHFIESRKAIDDKGYPVLKNGLKEPTKQASEIVNEIKVQYIATIVMNIFIENGLIIAKKYDFENQTKLYSNSIYEKGFPAIKEFMQVFQAELVKNAFANNNAEFEKLFKDKDYQTFTKLVMKYHKTLNQSLLVQISEIIQRNQMEVSNARKISRIN